mmetsp:Transcript_35433/g.97833  ORF Transcript_35433/g.97833 Transcript_35433/m.97833 type:complete len:245 (-) Transcript_35433:129-863(-)
MSSAEEAPKRRPRRGPANRRNRRRPQSTEDGEPRQRVEYPPVPADKINTSATGMIHSIIVKGRGRFGFILIGETSDVNAIVPRVYFSLSKVKDPAVILRRGYPVSFNIKSDEEGRSFAEDVALTEEGKSVAAEREAKIAARRAEDEANGKPPRRERKPREPRMVKIKVVCEGKSGEKEIEMNLNQSVGRIKGIASEAFEADADFNVYHVTDAAPKGEFLTRAIMATLTDGAKILLAPKREEATA